MKDSYYAIPGLKSESWYGPANGGSGSRMSEVPAAMINTISGYYSEIGNRKIPTAHRYNLQRSTNMNGLMTETLTPTNGAPSGYTVSGFIGGTPQVIPMSGTGSYNRAIEKLYEQLRGSLDLSVSLAEGGQVIGMIRKASKLSTYLSGFTRKTAANNWLMYTYGIKPLVSDLHGSINQLANFAGNSLSVSSRSTEREYFQKDSRDEYTVQADAFTNSNRTEIQMKYLPSGGFVNTLARFSSLNPASIAWELMPYSFVFDWFIDVGGYLRNLETALAFPGSVLSGYISTSIKLRCDQTVSYTGKKDPAGWIKSGGQTGYIEKISFQRARLYALPIPRLPTFSVNMGASRLLSAASLLAQGLGIPRSNVKRMRKLTEAKWKSFTAKHRRGPLNPWDNPQYWK